MNWILQHKIIIIGALVGALGGFLYWNYIGCLSGTCAITSSPVNSTIYFSFMGGLLFSAFKKKNSENKSS
jgi:hypothetical protein